MMETGFFFASVAALVFSLYRLFLANNATTLGVSLFRVSLSILAVAVSRSEEASVLTTSVLLFVLLSILVTALVRNEVQLKND